MKEYTPTTWKEIVDNLADGGFINPDIDKTVDPFDMGEYELTYSDYFKKEYMKDAVDNVLHVYGFELASCYDFVEELLKGCIALVDGELKHFNYVLKMEELEIEEWR